MNLCRLNRIVSIRVGMIGGVRECDLHKYVVVSPLTLNCPKSILLVTLTLTAHAFL